MVKTIVADYVTNGSLYSTAFNRNIVARGTNFSYYFCIKPFLSPQTVFHEDLIIDREITVFFNNLFGA